MMTRWNHLPEAPTEFTLAHPELPPIILSILYQRGIREEKEIEAFLHPTFERDLHDPFLFRDMRKAVRRLMRAIDEQEIITIHGDYDADGVSASVILTSAFRAIGYEHTNVYLPHRETDGYGLNLRTVETLHDEGTRVIITCDCGISNVAEVARARELGIDVIITDHHSIPETLPDAYAIIHPKIEGETYPDQTLAGGGVAYKLMQGILAVYRESHDTLPSGYSIDTFEKLQLDMAAIASVADMVPLIGESRAMTTFGLEILNLMRDGRYANPRVGIRKFFHEIGLLHSDETLAREITPDTIGFQIAPRINAAGRLDHANVAFELLMTDSGVRAVDLAHQLEGNNQARRDLTKSILEEAIAQFEAGDPESSIIFVLGENWPSGLNGLVASRLAERFGKPAFVATRQDDLIVGSGRSKPYYDMVAAMRACDRYFVKFGGHPMACGFSCQPDMFTDMREAMLKTFEKMTAGADTTPTIDIDITLALDRVDLKLCEELRRLEPYGQANKKPVFASLGVTIKKVQTIGSGGNHLKLLVYGETPKIRKLIGWRMAEGTDGINWSKELETGDRIDVAYNLEINEWNGRSEPQFTIVDVRRSSR